MVTGTNITHYRGDSLALQLTLWTDLEHTVPADLADAVVTAQIREDADDAEVAASFDVGIAGNVVTATLSPESSRDLPPLGAWDVEVDWFGDDTVVQTVAAGKIATVADVTRWRV
jgi:hypothetical protein